jgi:hypothetical protein
VDEAQWVPLEEASQRVAYKDLRAALEEAQRRLAGDAGTGEDVDADRAR